MLIALFLSALQQVPAQQPTPRREVPDSGVVVTNPQVSPAGVQSVFNGRVNGVKFGAPGEIWVAVGSGRGPSGASSAFHLSWADNRVIGQAPLPGRAGVYGVAIDPVTNRAILSAIGRGDTSLIAHVPGLATKLAATNLTQVFGFPSTAGTPLTPAFSTVGLGDDMAGSPAIARRAGPDGQRLMVVPLPANDGLAVLNAETGKPLRIIDLGVVPLAAVLSPDGTKAYVTVFGGAKPKAGDRQASECCDPRTEAVRVDTAGLVERGSVEIVDIATGQVTHELTVGRHPTGLVWDEQRGRLYVTNGNSDDVSIVDTKTDKVLPPIPIVPFAERKAGLAPEAVALSPDGNTLYVALAGINAVAVYDISNATKAAFRGLIPTGWYPTTLDVSADGKHLAVGALLGVGMGDAPAGRAGRGADPRNAAGAKIVSAERGSVNVIAVPTAKELGAYTTAVLTNNHLRLATTGAEPTQASRANVAPRPIPERTGEPSPIQHVVYIIRENRTYDQILGDMGRGASDPRLVQFGQDVTPNAHALSNQYTLLDHFFASGGNSGDGHNWVTQANETDYGVWPLYVGRVYPSHSDDPLAYSSGGFIWQVAQEAHKQVIDFGEYSAEDPSSGCKGANRMELLNAWHDSTGRHEYFKNRLEQLCHIRSDIPSLDKALVHGFPNWTLNVPDVVRAEAFMKYLDDWTAAKAMPNLTLIQLPSDHTGGTTPGNSTPRAMVADNDLALGKIVEALSHSPFWNTMAIFVVEDDAQSGVDHIDGHRTVALAISPYIKRGTIDSTFYNQTSMTKSIELILGLPAMSIYDLISADMHPSFIGPNEKPDFTPYTAVVPQVAVLETNARVGDIKGPDAAARKAAALASAKMDFSHEDAAPTDALNKILWHDAKGWKTPYPGARQSLFFPLAVDLGDDEREELEERRRRGGHDDDDRPAAATTHKPVPRKDR